MPSSPLQKDTIRSTVSGSVQRKQPASLFFVYFVGIVALLTAALYASTHFTGKPAFPNPPHRLLQNDVERRVGDVCGRIAAEKAKNIETVGYENVPGRDGEFLTYWEVTCRAGRFLYSVQVDADSGEVLSIRRDALAGSETDASSLRLAAPVPHREALRNARGYLALCGLTLPADITPIVDKPGYIFTFRYPLPGDRARLVHIRIDAADGSLESLQNLVSRNLARTRKAKTVGSGEPPSGESLPVRKSPRRWVRVP